MLSVFSRGFSSVKWLKRRIFPVNVQDFTKDQEKLEKKADVGYPLRWGLKCFGIPSFKSSDGDNFHTGEAVRDDRDRDTVSLSGPQSFDGLQGEVGKLPKGSGWILSHSFHGLETGLKVWKCYVRSRFCHFLCGLQFECPRLISVHTWCSNLPTDLRRLKRKIV